MAAILMLVLLAALTGDTILANQCFHGNDNEVWLEVVTKTHGDRLEANCTINGNSTTNPTFTWKAIRPLCETDDTGCKTLELVSGLLNVTSSPSMSSISINHYRLFGFWNVTLYCLVQNVTIDNVSPHVVTDPSDNFSIKAQVGMNQTNGAHNITSCDIDSYVMVKQGESHNLTRTYHGKEYSVRISATLADKSTAIVKVWMDSFMWNETLKSNQQPGSDVIMLEMVRAPDVPFAHLELSELEITFPVEQVDAERQKPKCAVFSSGNWETKHCKTEKQNGSVQCNCTQGSQIAVLMIEYHTCKHEPCEKVEKTIGSGTGHYYSISIPPRLGDPVSVETEVIPKKQYGSPIYKDAESEVRFCGDVLVVKVLDQAETELTDFHQDPVVLGFPIHSYDASIEEPLCCFLETGSTWSDEGCSVSYKNSTFVQCSCTHLTSFAILMRPVEFELSPGDERILEILTKIGLALSITCLTVTLLVYAMCRMRSLRIVIHADLAFALLAAHILFLFLETKDEVACRCIAISLHFFLLAAFVWMFLEGAFLLIKAKPTFRWKVKMPVWLVVGWGCPAVIVLISMGFNFDGYKNDQACWLSTDFNFRWAFLAPVVVIIMANTALLVKLIFVFMSLQTNKKKDEAQKMKAGLRLVLILEPMLGIPWLFGLFYQSVVFSYIFVILNTLQGVFLFVAQCLLDHEVRRKIMKFNPDKTGTKVMSLTSSTSGQAGKNTGVTSSIMTSQSGAPSRLFVITNKIQKEEEVPDKKPDSELAAPDQEQLATEKQEGSVTSASSLGKIEDIDDDLKIQPERSTSFMLISMSSGTFGDEGTSEEPEQEPFQPISLSVDSTPGTDEKPDPENSSSSSSPSTASTLEGMEEELELPGSDTAAILNENQDQNDWKVFKEGTSSSASESKNRRKTAWSKDRSAPVKIWRL